MGRFKREKIEWKTKTKLQKSYRFKSLCAEVMGKYDFCNGLKQDNGLDIQCMRIVLYDESL